MSDTAPRPRPASAVTRIPAGHVFLIGFMGSGKSTVGRFLARELEMPFVDLDAAIESREGRRVTELFAERGEAAFRAMETDVLASLQDAEPSLVACGGGIVLSARNRELLGSLGCVVYLEVTAGEALARIGDVEGRPLLAAGGPHVAATLLAAREGLYRSAADVVIDTGGKPPAVVVREAVTALRAAGCPS